MRDAQRTGAWSSPWRRSVRVRQGVTTVTEDERIQRQTVLVSLVRPVVTAISSTAYGDGLQPSNVAEFLDGPSGSLALERTGPGLGNNDPYDVDGQAESSTVAAAGRSACGRNGARRLGRCDPGVARDLP